MDNKNTFGFQAKTYAAVRPHYPDALYEWIAKEASRHEQAWDVGTGSGQAALGLAQYFRKVYASDLSEDQIAHAPSNPKILYDVASAERSNLPENSVDAITVATALHWFDHPKFWQEVRRVARKGAIFCAWTYHRGQTDEGVQTLLIDPISEVLQPYWSDGNRLSWRGYDPQELRMPFEVILAPEFSCELEWTPAQIASFIHSWSAHQKARLDGQEEKLSELTRSALEKLGEQPRMYSLPLNILAARIS